jgi:hypothetical protein
MVPANLVGVGVRYTNADRGHMHVGLIYEDPQGQPSFAHLAFHHDLRKDAPPNEEAYLWADCAWLADPGVRSNAEYLADFIETCIRNTNVDYGIDPPDDAFDASGQYIDLDPSKGLTCATFIAAVLRSAGFPVVDLSTWCSRAEDDDWGAGVMRLLQHLAPARAAQLQGQTVAFRLKPDELAAATADIAIPVSFERAIELAEPLREPMLDAARGA